MSAQVAVTVPGRNPRRRQRNDSEDRNTLSVRQPQRKKSKLSDETFKAPIDPQTSSKAEDKLLNGHAPAGDHSRDPNSTDREMPMRGKPSSPPHKKSKREEGSAILTKNTNFVVQQLPSLPEQLRTLKPDYYRATACPSIGLCLAVTKDHVFVWDYNSPLTIPPNRVFPLSQRIRNVGTLSYGSFATNGSTSEVGLVVVSPSGHVCFWENIENADALSLFEQQRNGVQGSIGSLYAGEQVIGVESAEHAGFIVILSSGRVVQLLVRDTQSRPCIKATYLRGQNSDTGFLGGIKYALGGGGWLKDVVAAKSRSSPSVRGLVNVLIGNNAGQMQHWKLDWTGRPTFQADIDIQTVTVEAAQNAVSKGSDTAQLEITTIDFEISSRSTQGEADAFVLHTLVAVACAEYFTFALVQIELEDSIPSVSRFSILKSYSSQPAPALRWKPKLCIPKECHTAFVVFEQAVALVSLTNNAPVSQSEEPKNSEASRVPFQDTVYFREDGDIGVLGASAESPDDRNRNPGTVLFVSNFGVVRVTSFEQKSESDADDRIEVSAKSRIEQAVFYGNKPQTPLNLSKKPDVTYDQKQVEEAAEEISIEIVNSKSTFIPSVTSSMDYHLGLRAILLKTLANHLKYAYPSLSRRIKWRLRWDAEKIAAAKRVWELYDKSIRDDPKRKKLLPEIIDYLQDDRKSTPAVITSDFDHTRYYFIHDLMGFDDIIVWARQAIQELETDKAIPNNTVMFTLIIDAIDVLAGGLEAAFAFRQKTSWLYGLEDEEYIDGVLQDDYDDLPEFWTSRGMIPTEAVKLAKGAYNAATESKVQGDEVELAKKIGEQTGRLVRICCLCYEERYRRALGSSNEERQQYGRRLKEVHRVERSDLIKMLWNTEPEAGMAIAEKYSDMDALVELLFRISGQLLDRTRDSTSSEILTAARESEALESRVREYFIKFGPAWGDAFYSTFVRKGSLYSLLDNGKAYDSELTRFLNADTGRKKIGWINEVVAHKNYRAAGNALRDVAVDQEENIWNKKVEVSLSRLSYLAAEERQKPKPGLPTKNGSLTASRIPSRVPTPQLNNTAVSAPSWNDIPADLPLPSQPTVEADMAVLDSASTLIVVQEALYSHIRPTIYGATDEIASLQLVMAAYGVVRTANLTALQQLLERGFESLLQQRAMAAESLIDVLTLMDTKSCEIARDDISGTEFARALLVLVNSGLDRQDKNRFEMLVRTIWRRTYIADDWKQVNSTRDHTDDDNTDVLEGTVLFKTILVGRRAGILPAPNAKTSTSGSLILPAPPSPHDVLTAGINPQDHVARFGDPSLCEPIARDNAREDDILSQYIRDFGLEGWVRVAGEWADNVLAAENEADKDGNAQVRGLAEIEAEMRGEGSVDDTEEPSSEMEVLPSTEGNGDWEQNDEESDAVDESADGDGEGEEGEDEDDGEDEDQGAQD